MKKYKYKEEKEPVGILAALACQENTKLPNGSAGAGRQTGGDRD